MRAYKGFNKDMTCRGFQYEEGKTYETDKAKLCAEGFHACENPLDCFRYYEPGASVYREVEIEDNGERHSEDSKVVGKKITIGAELSVAQICKLHFEYTKEHAESEKQGGYYSALQGGNYSALQGGNCSALQGGNCSALQGGNRSALQGGDRSALQGGNYSALQGGNCSALQGGDASVLRGGIGTKFKGGMHSVFACEVRDEDYNLIGMKTAVVDGKKILPDIWYTVKNGKWVKVKE